MANVIQDIYRLDVDPNSALNIAKLAQSITALDQSQQKAGKSADELARDEAELAAQTRQLNLAMNQEVKTIQGLEAKQKLLRESIRGLTIGSKEYNTIQKELSKTNQSLDTTFGKSSGVVSSLKGAVLGLIGPYIGVAGAIAIVTKSIEAYAAKEALINRLSLVLNGNAESLKRLADQEDRIEGLTLFDGDEIQKAQTYAIVAGRTVEETKKLIEVATDLATVYNLSLSQALKLLIDGEDGYTKALRKAIPAAREFTDEQIKAGVATKELGNQVKGAAEAIATGMPAAINKVQDQIGNLLENIGELFSVYIPAYGLALVTSYTSDLNILLNETIIFANRARQFFIGAKLSFGFGDVEKDSKKLLELDKDINDRLLENTNLRILKQQGIELQSAIEFLKKKKKKEGYVETGGGDKDGGGKKEAAAIQKELEAGSLESLRNTLSKLKAILDSEVNADTPIPVIKNISNQISEVETKIKDLEDLLKRFPQEVITETPLLSPNAPSPVVDGAVFNLERTKVGETRKERDERLKRGKEREKDARDDFRGIVQEAADIAQDITQVFSDAIVSPFEQAAQRLDQLVEQQRNAYENALANSEDFNDAQIEIERTRLIEAEAQQRQAAEKARTASQIQVAAFTAIAIARAVAEGGGLFSFATVAAVLAALAGGLSQIGSITQGFHDGSDFVTGKRGRDKIPAMIEHGEAVIQADANERYHPLIKDIRRKTKHADFALKALEASKSGQAALGYQIFNDFSPLVSEQKKTNKILKDQSNLFKNTRIRLRA